MIRPARPEHVTQLAALAAELRYPVPASESAAYLDRIIPSPGHAVLVAEMEGGQLVVWIHGFVARRLFVPEFAEFGGLVVRSATRPLKPEYQARIRKRLDRLCPSAEDLAGAIRPRRVTLWQVQS